jgi:hypothetical protein
MSSLKKKTLKVQQPAGQKHVSYPYPGKTPLSNANNTHSSFKLTSFFTTSNISSNSSVSTSQKTFKSEKEYTFQQDVSAFAGMLKKKDVTVTSLAIQQRPLSFNEDKENMVNGVNREKRFSYQGLFSPDATTVSPTSCESDGVAASSKSDAFVQMMSSGGSSGKCDSSRSRTVSTNSTDNSISSMIEARRRSATLRVMVEKGTQSIKIRHFRPPKKGAGSLDDFLDSPNKIHNKGTDMDFDILLAINDRIDLNDYSAQEILLMEQSLRNPLFLMQEVMTLKRQVICFLHSIFYFFLLSFLFCS